MSPSAPNQTALLALVESKAFRRTIVALIVLSAIIMGVETMRSLPVSVLNALALANQVILFVFVVEVSLRILAYRGAFFRRGWNLFDFVIVVVALIPPPGPLQVLRALRIVRTLRLVSAVPSLRRVVDGLMAALPGLGSILALLMLLLYVAGVMATHLYRDVSPEYFDGLNVSLMTLFQILTLENWPDIAGPIMAVDPYAWIFFVGFILVGTFMILNLFIGVVVSAILARINAEAREESEALQELVAPPPDPAVAQAALHAAIGHLSSEIAALRAELETRRDTVERSAGPSQAV